MKKQAKDVRGDRGHCKVYGADEPTNVRRNLQQTPGKRRLFVPETVTKEEIGPGNDDWAKFGGKRFRIASIASYLFPTIKTGPSRLVSYHHHLQRSATASSFPSSRAHDVPLNPSCVPYSPRCLSNGHQGQVYPSHCLRRDSYRKICWKNPCHHQSQTPDTLGL
jgi:hypothetical protein